MWLLLQAYVNLK
jgi:hypothetical protein